MCWSNSLFNENRPHLFEFQIGNAQCVPKHTLFSNDTPHIGLVVPPDDHELKQRLGRNALPPRIDQ